MNTNRNTVISIVVIVAVVGVISFLLFRNKENTTGGAVACTMEAKLCPDGSYVGRHGPSCDFDACPVATTTTSDLPSDRSVTLSVGQKGTVSGVSITVNSLEGDSRCPTLVVCIQAGTVTANITIEDGSRTETRNISISKVPYDFDSHLITLDSVSPARDTESAIPEANYRFTFLVSAAEKG